VGPRVGLDSEARGKIILPLPGIEPQSNGRPAGNNKSKHGNEDVVFRGS
jgi:hypothetical protein